MELKDFINSKEIAIYIDKLPPQTNIDQILFPNDKQYGMEIELAKGALKRPVAIRMSQFDTAAKVRALKAQVSVEKKEMPFFKEAVGISEKDRRDLMLAKNANNQNLINFLVKQVYENYAELVAGADVQASRMRAQILQKGEVNIVTDDGDIVVDYGVPTEHKVAVDAAKSWDKPGADIVGDIIKWQKLFTNAGLEKPTRMLLTEKTFGYITQNNAIREELNARNIGTVILVDEDFKGYLKRKLGIELGILDGVYLDEKGTLNNYYEDDKISLIPQGALGRTIYGTTPEEFDSKFGSGKLDTSVLAKGIAITTMVKEDPVTVDTKISQIVLPSFDKANNCLFATVVPTAKESKKK